MDVLRQATAADLVVSKRLTKYPEEYTHASHSAIAAQSLRVRGVHLRPGETVQYLICNASARIPAERVRPVAILSDNPGYDEREYERLLREAFRPFMVD